MQTQTEPLQTLPDSHTEFVFTVSGGGWGLAVLALLVVAALAALAVWWWRRGHRG